MFFCTVFGCSNDVDFVEKNWGISLLDEQEVEYLKVERVGFSDFNSCMYTKIMPSDLDRFKKRYVLGLYYTNIFFYQLKQVLEAGRQDLADQMIQEHDPFKHIPCFDGLSAAQKFFPDELYEKLQRLKTKKGSGFFDPESGRVWLRHATGPGDPPPPGD